MYRIKPADVIDGKIIWESQYYTLGRKYIKGQSIRYFFPHGYIELIDEEVVAGDIAFKDGNSYMSVYVFNGELNIFRASAELGNSLQYATDKSMFTASKFFKLNKIKSVLNKTYDYPYVEEFMELARKVFYSRNLDKEFDSRYGDYIYEVEEND